MAEHPRQLPLELPHEQALGRDDYLVGSSNRAAVELIDSWPNWPSTVAILAGPVGAGKTHLVQIWSSESGATVLPASELAEGMVADLVAEGPVALEDAHSGINEVALFHLLNAAKQTNRSVLLTSRTWASAWGLKLPDLISRLRAATPVEIEEPDDELLQRVLVKLFADRQLNVDASIVEYLVMRMERSLGVADEVVDLLDREALASGAKISRQLAGKVLEKMQQGEV